MSDHWDFFFSEVDDGVASIFVDLGIAAEAPISGLGEHLGLFLTMRQPREDGLSSSEEFERLSEIEDALTAALAGCNVPVQFVGRITAGGRRDFHFYTSDPKVAAACLRKAMAAFPEYSFEIKGHSDPSWTLYSEFLYPSPREKQSIENRKVFMALQEAGDNPDIARNVDHWIYFATSENREQFLAEAETQGFHESSRRDDAKDERPYMLCVSSDSTTDLTTIDELVLTLHDLAEAFEAEYDGWETSVQKG